MKPIRLNVRVFSLLFLIGAIACKSQTVVIDQTQSNCGCNNEVEGAKYDLTVAMETIGSTSTLRGKVYDENYEPLVGATAEVEELGLSAIVDMDGLYELKNIPEGSYTINIEAIGYGECSMRNVEIEGGKAYEASPVQVCKALEVLLKPVLYLYPTESMDVSVQLDYQGQLKHTYPRYRDGWKVKAEVDGTLIDENGRSYYALFWEGFPSRGLSMSNASLVAGENSLEFLESSLEILGLNEREANEFIMFWLPQLEDNPYNLIHFSKEEYEQSCKLLIEPQVETVIRVMMVYRPLNVPVDFVQQELTPAPDRKGFTAVEWGGCKFNEGLQIYN